MVQGQRGALALYGLHPLLGIVVALAGVGLGNTGIPIAHRDQQLPRASGRHSRAWRGGWPGVAAGQGVQKVGNTGQHPRRIAWLQAHEAGLVFVENNTPRGPLQGGRARIHPVVGARRRVQVQRNLRGGIQGIKLGATNADGGIRCAQPVVSAAGFAYCASHCAKAATKQAQRGLVFWCAVLVRAVFFNFEPGIGPHPNQGLVNHADLHIGIGISRHGVTLVKVLALDGLRLLPGVLGHPRHAQHILNAANNRQSRLRGQEQQQAQRTPQKPRLSTRKKMAKNHELSSKNLPQPMVHPGGWAAGSR